MGNFAFFPHTGDDIRAMLERIGVQDLDDLYSDVPAEFLRKGEYNLPESMSEQEVRDYFNHLASMNVPLTVFVGAGAYDHYTPSVIPYLTSRSEFLTAYTPYQCEISQGTLRYIFEYQSMMCALTGLDVSNASMYDGPTAAAEAVRMCLSATRKKSTVLVSEALLPHVINVIKTYSRFYGNRIEMISMSEGRTSLEDMKRLLESGEVSGAIVPGISRYGCIEDLTGFADALHAAGALMVEYCDPSTLAVLRTPAEWGADIAVGDAQSLGIPLSYGGPYIGFIACRKEHMRKLPGRIVGETRDSEGRRVFVLTLQAREQHIRREKATSNICSNESLMALWVTIYLSIMGPEGLRKINTQSSANAHYLYEELLKTGRFKPAFDAPFINEFVLKPLSSAEDIQRVLSEAGFFAALELDGYVSFCATEKRTRAEIDALVNAIRRAAL